MRVWKILPTVNLGKLVEPDEFRAVRNTRGDGKSLVRGIFERFPLQPAMPAQHPAMAGDSALYAGRNPIFLMHPIDGLYFPYALKLSNKINAIKRSAKTVENELVFQAATDARAVQRELQNLDYRVSTGAAQRLAQSQTNSMARLEAFDKMALARAVGHNVVPESMKSGAGLPAAVKKSVAGLESRIESKLTLRELPVGIEAQVLLASQSAAAIAVGAYQSLSQGKAGSTLSNVLGTVPAIPAINLKI